MKPVFAIASYIISASGLGLSAHWSSLASKTSGIRKYSDERLSAVPFFASLMSPEQWEIIRKEKDERIKFTAFEQMAFFSAKKAIESQAADLNPDETVFILSSTKGNIELLGRVPDKEVLLSHSAFKIADALGVKNPPVVISQACISGVAAYLYGLRVLQSGRYKNAVITGADRVTKFVLSGFQSFQAVAQEPCRPFDAERSGINLGEAAATIILSTGSQNKPLAQLVSGATSNDANHISGPSRTGEELAIAIGRSLKAASVLSEHVHTVSAHGTATLYNDEMESRAFAKAGISHVPVHSLKGLAGHTLGTAGVLETALLVESIRRQTQIPSIGFKNIGVSQPLSITKEMAPARIEFALKTASGFGGCNAAAIWKAV